MVSRPRRTSSADKAPSPSDEPTVELRVRFDSAQTHDTVVRVPRSFLEVRDGKVVGLEGPRVRIDTAHKIQRLTTAVPLGGIMGGILGRHDAAREVTTEAPMTAVQPDARGNFVDPAIDTGQTTSFYAATQVLQLAERVSGRRVVWGDEGRLTVIPRQWVTTSALKLNGYFDERSDKVALGGLGDVRDGRVVPHTGSGLDLIDAAMQRESDVLAHETNPTVIAESQRRLDILKRFVGANAADEVIVAELIAHGELTDKRAALFHFVSGDSTEAADNGFPQDAVTPSETLFRNYMLYYQAFADGSESVHLVRPLNGVGIDFSLDRDVAAHEAAHAALAALKPTLQRTSAGRIAHEGYSDLMAIFTGCDDDATVNSALAETHGDLRRSNILSRLVEHGDDVYAKARRDGVRLSRDASEMVKLSSFTNVPDLLERTAPTTDDGSTIDAHGISRAMSGALYAAFAARANAAAAEARARGSSQAAAVRRVRDDAATILHDAVMLLPEDGGTLRDVGAALLVAARRHDGGRNGPWSSGVHEALRERDFPVVSDNGTPLMPSSMTDLPATRFARNATGAAILKNADVKNLLGDWLEDRASEMEHAYIAEDVRNKRGDRIIRFAFAEPATKQKRHDTDWVGAIVIDRSGRLIAASGSGADPL